MSKSESQAAREWLTAEEMRALEADAIAQGRVTGLGLMERAGRGTVDAIFSFWPELAASPQRAVVLCGPGNNGGDGFVIARLLKQQGWDVDVFFYGQVEGLPLDARQNFDRWKAIGTITSLSFPTVTEAEAEAFADAAYGVSETALVIDALFGIGLSRPLDGLAPITWLNDLYVNVGPELMPAHHVAVDVPSGLGENGPLLGEVPVIFSADLTVTFHMLKKAHHFGATSCGEIQVVSIGLD